MENGGTVVLGGLFQQTEADTVDKVPWLGDLPVIGAFFRSTSINKQEKELIMVVTPHLVRRRPDEWAGPRIPITRPMSVE